jgi:curved DNA-binding protein CbpA
MVDEAAAFTALGLKPGADWAEVERAYKALISAHHPDRPEGDQARAAEITQAYRELRRSRDRKDELELAEHRPLLGARGYRWMWALPGFLILAGVLVFANRSSPPQTAKAGIAATAPQPSARSDHAMEASLAISAIDASINRARRIASVGDEMALAAASRDCHHELRVKPSIERFDGCAAFDDAVVQLQDRDPLRDQGPFSEIAVTSRQMSAGSLLSDDSLAIDGRLDRIRLQVELALAPSTGAAN